MTEQVAVNSRRAAEHSKAVHHFARTLLADAFELLLSSKSIAINRSCKAACRNAIVDASRCAPGLPDQAIADKDIKKLHLVVRRLIF